MSDLLLREKAGYSLELLHHWDKLTFIVIDTVIKTNATPL